MRRWNTNVNLSNGVVTPQFLGYDVVVTQVLDGVLGPDSGKVNVVFGDLNKGVMLGTRRGITIVYHY